MTSITRAVSTLQQMFNELDRPTKFAFLVHEPSMLAHYKDVWEALDPSEFTILLTQHFAIDEDGNDKRGAKEFLAYVGAKNLKYLDVDTAIDCGIKFEYVISNHMIAGSSDEIPVEIEDEQFTKQLNRGLLLMGKEPVWRFGAKKRTYLPLQVGKKQIRYMYGADISEGWSLKKWNTIYDIFLCHGVNDEREINKRFSGKTYVMGYPRYDRFFSEAIDLDAIRNEFCIAKTKKTVLWMPTLGGDYSSIPVFAEALSSIRDRYNLIVRPHPISFVLEKEFIQKLEMLGFTIDRNAIRDMNELFGVADVVLADNGGTPFSAIFLGKNVIFLDVPEPATDSYFSGSSVLELKKYLPTIKANEIHRLDSMLDSNEFFIENSKHIETLFKIYFDSPRGGGAARVADILRTL